MDYGFYLGYLAHTKIHIGCGSIRTSTSIPGTGIFWHIHKITLSYKGYDDLLLPGMYSVPGGYPLRSPIIQTIILTVLYVEVSKRHLHSRRVPTHVSGLGTRGYLNLILFSFNPLQLRWEYGLSHNNLC